MPKGFFSKKETESISATDGKIHSCASCGLYRNCDSPKMKPQGKGQKDIMIIGEAPEFEDDHKGKFWQGEKGQLLKQTFAKHGIKLSRDCISIKAINCYPGANKAPTGQEIAHCRSVIVWKAVQKYQPKVIIPLGKAALRSLIGHRWKKGINIKKWRGWTIPDQEIKSWICPTFAPGYLIAKNKEIDLIRIWLDDLKQAIDKKDEDFPIHKKPKIEYVKDLRFLNNWPNKLSAFDYETTGIKPHAKGHQILTCSIAKSKNRVFVFKGPKNKKKWQPFRRWLANPNIPKIAQNMKFEHQWSKEFLKISVKGWAWDTMLASHIIDNRTGTTGLKFKTYIRFGIMGFEDEVSPYIKSVNKDKFGENAHNRLKKLISTKRGEKELLNYNALDSIYEYQLAKYQMELLNYKLSF